MFNFTSALLAPVVPALTSSDTVVNALEPVASLLYQNTVVLTITTFICCCLLIVFGISSVLNAFRRSKKERSSND